MTPQLSTTVKKFRIVQVSSNRSSVLFSELNEHVVNGHLKSLKLVKRKMFFFFRGIIMNISVGS